MDGKSHISKHSKSRVRRKLRKLSPFNATNQRAKLEELRTEKERKIASELYELTKPSSPRNKLVRDSPPIQTPSITIHYGKDDGLSSSSNSVVSSSFNLNLSNLGELASPPSPRSDRSPRELLGHSPRDIIRHKHPTSQRLGKQEAKILKFKYEAPQTEDYKRMLQRMECIENEMDHPAKPPIYDEIRMYTLGPDLTKIPLKEDEFTFDEQTSSCDRTSFSLLSDRTNLNDEDSSEIEEIEESEEIEKKDTIEKQEGTSHVDEMDDEDEESCTSDYEKEWVPALLSQDQSQESGDDDSKQKPLLKRLGAKFKRKKTTPAPKTLGSSTGAVRQRRRMSLSLGRAAGRRARNPKTGSWRNLFGYFDDKGEVGDRIVRDVDG